MNARTLLPLLAALSAAPEAFAQNPTQDDEIVVTAERPRGSVPGDFVPETTFSSEDIRSYGATSIFQILAALAPQTGSASIRGGGGMPIVLVNGRRITGFQEIRDLPPEVISRVEVFDEQLALQYGYSADQRVVNLILTDSYSSRSLEGAAGGADVDARATGHAEARSVRIDEGNRFTYGASYDAATKVTELERGIAPPVSGPDARADRTLAPDSESWRVNTTLSRALNERITGNASFRYEGADQTSLLGLDSLAQRRTRDTQSETLRGTLGLDGAVSGWQWTATATADVTNQDSQTTDSTAPSRTTSDQTLLDVAVNANGAIMSVPAGRLRGSFRAGVENRQLESSSRDIFGDRSADLERTTPSARATLILPVTSRRRNFGKEFGDINLNVTGTWSSPSDFDTLTGAGFGASWAPTSTIRFTLQTEHSEAAPSIQQLGDAETTTPDVFFFDPILGADANVTYTTGGNPDLTAEERDDVTFNASWSPTRLRGLTALFSWAQNNSANAIVGFPTSLPEAVLAFPSRFTRDLGGNLIAVDARPINIASRDIQTIRYGFNYSRQIGGRGGQGQASAEGQGQGGARRGAPPAGDDSNAPDQQRPTLAPGGGQNGRWNISVFHRVRIADDLVLSSGSPTIDLLDRGGLALGETASSIEFEGGAFYKGLGFRLNGGWSDSYSVPIASGGALDFSDRWTVNARLFLNFDNQAAILEAAPLLRGSRLMFSIDNLTDSFVEVRDETGATPTSYQRGYQNRLGRVFQISLQKQF